MKTLPFILYSICTLIGAAPSLSAADPRPDLVGRVEDADGSPVAKASVFIYTAGPKKGTSTFCPSCYADCRKQTRTGADGRFKIESLDPTLLFRLLVVAPGHESTFATIVDPARGEQEIVLNPLSDADLTSNRRIKGVVVGEDGKPVPEAVISPEGVGLGQSTQWGGSDSYVEPLAVADEQGRFTLYCKSPRVDLVHATANGRGVAKQWVSLKPGGDYLIRMREGVKVTGTIVQDGQPLRDVTLAYVTTDRTCGKYFNGEDTASDSNGHFQMWNVPPEREFYIYSKMDALHGSGTLPNTKFTTGASGATQDLGKLPVQPVFKVAGRIVLADGKSIPAGTRLLLGREKTMDVLQVTLGADGAFEFTGVPKGSISMSLRIKGYQLSKRNPSFDRLGGQILGRVAGDVQALDILMEPGEWLPNEDDGLFQGNPADGYPADKPLRGAKL